jgi:uncharacterized protein (DUF2141 family)
MKTRTAAIACLCLAGAMPATAQTAPATPAAPAAPAAQGQSTLVIAFSGIERPGGSIMVALFDGEAGWQSGPPLRAALVPISGNAAEVRFEGLPPGRYGVKSFHDVDDDRRLGTNPFGVPIEPFAFSNNARGAMGPPNWAQAAFEIGAGETRHAITIR